ncbi:MAG: hypothetical protein QM604_00115 [Microbacterium sp.]
MKRSSILLGGAIAFGALVLASAGPAAFADDTSYGDGDVDVNVTVPESTAAGALSLTVDGDSTDLTQADDDSAGNLVFTGTLPTVTVTDTRAADDIDADASWYVLGSATDFTGADTGDTFSSNYLGWSPALVGDIEDGTVGVGGDVAGTVDGGDGLSDLELLYATGGTSAEAVDGAGAGVYSANATLTLKVPATTTADTYTSVLTLSLFE